ncbi:probable Mip [[Actinomadura] parvosata subsp. kistnae]|nr:probable Mip [Actinomadura parvosata subsp. kistnae]
MQGAVQQDILDRRGSVGEMVAAMAHSPALLEGYLNLSRATSCRRPSARRSRSPMPTSPSCWRCIPGGGIFGRSRRVGGVQDE